MANETQITTWAPTSYRIKCLLGRITQDQDDDSDYPDLWTMGGTVVLTPAVGRGRVIVGASTYMASIDTLTCQIIPETGELMGPTGVVGVQLLDPALAVDIDPHGWTWHAKVTPNAGSVWEVDIDGSVAVDGVIDLAAVATVPSSPGTTVVEGRLAALEAAWAAELNAFNNEMGA